MAKTDIVTIDGKVTSTDVVKYVQDPAGFRIEMIKEDPDEVAARIMGRLLSAETADDIFGPAETLSSKTYINKPFRIDSVDWVNSETNEDFPLFAVLSIITAEGSHEVLTTGAKKPCTQIALADSKGLLPVWVKFTSTKTSRGFDALDLVSAPNPLPDTSVKGEEAF